MKPIFLSLFFFFSSLQLKGSDTITSQFPKNGNSPHSFVPTSWKILAFAEGDLNADKKKDFALVIESPREKRLLLILWNRGKELEIFQALAGVVPSKTTKQDNFSGISIRGGKLWIEEHGGENLAWKVISAYQFRKDAFFLIFQKNIDINLKTSKIREREMDFLKGVQTIRVFSGDGTLESERIVKSKKQTLQKLTSKVNQ